MENCTSMGGSILACSASRALTRSSAAPAASRSPAVPPPAISASILRSLARSSSSLGTATANIHHEQAIPPAAARPTNIQGAVATTLTDTFAGRHDIVRHTKTDGVAQEIAHRPPRRIDRRLIAPRRVEPGAVHPGDIAVEVGYSSDHRRPGLGRRMPIRPVVAVGMKAEACGYVQSRNATFAQIRFDDCASNRLCHGEETAC